MVIDYAMAMYFKKKISVTHYFLRLEFVLISLSSISGICGENLSISDRNNNYDPLTKS